MGARSRWSEDKETQFLQTGEQGEHAEGEVPVDHPEMPGIRQLQAKAQPKTKTLSQYNSRFRILERYCMSQSPPWDPFHFSLELAYSFASFMLRRMYRGRPVTSLSGYFSAFNAVYRNHRPPLPELWAGRDIAALRNAFEDLQREASAGTPTGQMRKPVPAAIVGVILDRGEVATGQDKGWYAIFLLMFIMGFRADTIAGIDGPRDISRSGRAIRTTVTRVKRRGASRLRPITLETPMGSSDAHPRSRAFRLIIDARPYITTELFGDDPSRVSAMISDAMTRLIGPEVRAELPDACFCSSHSFRKAGASTLGAMQVSMYTIKKWGMWKTVTSPERYIDELYNQSPMTQQLMDHMLPLIGSAETYAEINWVREESDDEDAETTVPVNIDDIIRE